jgi:hypothetical protein
MLPSCLYSLREEERAFVTQQTRSMRIWQQEASVKGGIKKSKYTRTAAQTIVDAEGEQLHRIGLGRKSSLARAPDPHGYV